MALEKVADFLGEEDMMEEGSCDGGGEGGGFFSSRREERQETTSGWTFIIVSVYNKSVSNMFPVGTFGAGDFLNKRLFSCVFQSHRLYTQILDHAQP